MRRRIAGPLLTAFVLALAALSVGSAGMLAAAALIVLLLVAGWVSVRWASSTLTARTDVSPAALVRGEESELTLTVRHRCPLPVAPLLLRIAAAPGEPETTLTVPSGRSSARSLGVRALHAGICDAGIHACSVRDLFGFFEREVSTPDACVCMTVLPKTFDVEPLRFAPADAGVGTMATAREDASDPMDVRAWQRGDSLRKIHWKLSARRRTLLTRRFEEPAQPEALVLLDCTRPEPGAKEAYTRDALVETAASLFAAQKAEDCELRLPLWGEHPTELSLRMGLPLALERLAAVDFSASEGFDNELIDAARRVRQIGAAVVITSRLSGRMLEPLILLRRQGPTLRLYLVSGDPDRADWQPLIARLQRAEIEVCSVLPADMAAAGKPLTEAE